jgi:geranylgeranyl reductase family protein
MKTFECDILIVGAGPAGSSAALAAAERGLSVIIVERREQVGVPVRCAEFIPALLLGETVVGSDVVVQSITEMKTYLPNGDVKQTRAPGFIIMRDLFDQTLALAAVEAGSQLMVATRALCMDDGFAVIRNMNGVVSRVRAAVIIGADGPRSTVGAWVGHRNRSLLPAVQICAPLARGMNHVEVHFDREIYGGYAWLFPKGRAANVGLGIKKQEGHHPSIKNLLRNFFDRLRRGGKIKGSPYGWTAGWIPAEPLKKMVHKNVLLVGDAAGQTHPITGSGVYQAVVCGRMAGETAARALEAEDMGLLKAYESEWQGLFGDTMDRALKRRKLLEQKWDQLDEIIRPCWIAFREYYE